jgi:hypothetical protein
MLRQQDPEQFLRLVEAQTDSGGAGREATQAVRLRIDTSHVLATECLDLAAQVCGQVQQGVAVRTGLSGLLEGIQDGVGMAVGSLSGAVGGAGLSRDVTVGATQDSGGIADPDDSG